MAWKGLREDTLERAGILTEGNQASIPYRTPTGEVFRWRYRGPKDYWGPGNGTIPYGLETLPNALRASRSGLVICEGETDTLALREALSASPSRLGLYVLGCPGSLNWKPEWLVYVQDFRIVLAVGDGDDAGNAFQERMAHLIPGSLGLTVPDGEDVRSMLQNGRREECLAGIMEAFGLAELFLGEFPKAKDPLAGASC